MLAGVLDNVFINGDFLRGLWNRLKDPAAGVECPVWRHTYAADRWKIRYSRPVGSPVRQAMSMDVPRELAADRSLEIRGAHGVTESIYLGQRIESAEAPRYRRRLVFSAWVYIESAGSIESNLRLFISAAPEADRFADLSPEATDILIDEPIVRIPCQQWVRIEHEIDALHFSPNGLCVELEFPAVLLNRPDSRVRVTGLRLVDVSHFGREMERPAAIETLLAKRFFQRHDCTTINSLGRPIVINRHELHFQFSFPEMRSLPACTLPQDNESFRVFDIEGFPQTGFSYDVTYRSRGSLMVRATKENHCVRDGYLSFVGDAGAILLEAEL
jgi:hypothetical protein